MQCSEEQVGFLGRLVGELDFQFMGGFFIQWNWILCICGKIQSYFYLIKKVLYLFEFGIINIFINFVYGQLILLLVFDEFNGQWS